MGIEELSLRHLKSVLYVVRLGSVSYAADKLNRSQAAITLAVRDIETKLGVQLFNRSQSGMVASEYGQLLTNRIALMEQEFDEAGREYRRMHGGDSLTASNPVFSMELSYKRFAALIAVSEKHNVAAAASLIGVSHVAIYKSIREIESYLGLKLFQRDSNGMHPTYFCSLLVRQTKLAFAHLRHARDELSNLDGVTSGRVNLGMLPYSRTILVPRAVTQLLDRYPSLQVCAREGSYAQLEAPLRDGELDLIIGAVRTDSDKKGLSTEELFKDRLALIARNGHPLARGGTLSATSLQEIKWILPAADTPARHLFNEFLSRHSLGQKLDYIETSSLTTIRGLLLESDRVALLSEHQVHYETNLGVLTVLPIELEQSYRSIGVTMRQNSLLSPGVQRLLEQLRFVAGQIMAKTRLK